MGIISWIVLGLISGWLAKFFMPGVAALGWIKTTVLGVIGALVGGFISTALKLGSVNGLNLASVIISVIGAMLVIYVYRLVCKK